MDACLTLGGKERQTIAALGIFRWWRTEREGRGTQRGYKTSTPTGFEHGTMLGASSIHAMLGIQTP